MGGEDLVAKLKNFDTNSTFTNVTHVVDKRNEIQAETSGGAITNFTLVFKCCMSLCFLKE